MFWRTISVIAVKSLFFSVRDILVLSDAVLFKHKIQQPQVLWLCRVDAAAQNGLVRAKCQWDSVVVCIEISVLHCDRVLYSFKSDQKYSLGGCGFPILRNTALVKCHFVLRSLVAFTMYILPCFCTKIVKHTGVLALEIDLSSCLILTYTIRARVGVKEVGWNGVYSLNLEVEL